MRRKLVAWIPGPLRRAGRLVLSRVAREDALHEWRRQRQGEPALPGEVRRVVVICHGNICRSPFAGVLLATRCPEVEVRSAGLRAGEGNAAEREAQDVARDAFEVDLAQHRSHRLDAEDVAWADLIVGMEGHHAAAVRRDWPGAAAKTRLLGDFLQAPPHRIPDPWGQSREIFEQNFEQIERAVEQLARRIRK